MKERLHFFKFRFIKGGRTYVQFTYHSLRQKKTPPFVAVFFCFWTGEFKLSSPMS